jgi:hypothetical protein
MFADRDVVVSTWTLVTTADTAGWTLTFSDDARPIPIRAVSALGDSVRYEVGPFERPTQRGRMLTVRAVGRLRGGRLVGTFERRFVSTPDSIFRGRFEARRAP